MRVVDLNLLLYAVNADSSRHAAARKWLEQLFGSPDTIALPWVVVLGFVRLATSRRVFAKPLALAEALTIVDGWLGRPNVLALAPGPRHWPLLKQLLSDAGASGNLTTDAHLAALAVEHGCELCSTDSDFARFRQVRWTDPLATS